MSEMKSIPVSEMTGAALDWAVAKAEGGEYKPHQFGENIDAPFWDAVVFPGGRAYSCWSPSTDWSQCGPLIEQFNIQTSYNGNGFSRSSTGKWWCAYVCKPHGPEELPSGSGPTPLISACRAIVASKFGDTVEVPAELINA